MEHLNIPPENHVKVLGGQGWVGGVKGAPNGGNTCARRRLLGARGVAQEAGEDGAAPLGGQGEEEEAEAGVAEGKVHGEREGGMGT